MPRETSLLRLAVLTVAIVELFAFSSLTAAALFLMAVGIVLVIFSLLLENRFIALLAVTILGAEAAYSLDIESVLEIRMLLSAVLGVFLPLFAVGLIVLGPGAKPGTEKLASKRHLYMSSAIICVCILAVPMAALLLSVLAMTILLHMSTLIEIAVLIVAIVFCAVFGAMVRPRKKRMKMEGTEVG